MEKRKGIYQTLNPKRTKKGSQGKATAAAAAAKKNGATNPQAQNELTDEPEAFEIETAKVIGKSSPQIKKAVKRAGDLAKVPNHERLAGTGASATDLDTIAALHAEGETRQPRGPFSRMHTWSR